MLDLYDEGVADNALAQAQRARVGFVEYGVGEVRRMVEAARALVEATQKDAEASKNATALARWRPVYARWRVFYEGTQGFSGAFNQFRDKTAHRAEEYAKVAEEVRAFLRAQGQAVAPYTKTAAAPAGGGGPLPVSLPPKRLDGFSWKWALLLAGGAAVGYGVYRYVRPKRAAQQGETA